MVRVWRKSYQVRQGNFSDDISPEPRSQLRTTVTKDTGGEWVTSFNSVNWDKFYGKSTHDGYFNFTDDFKSLVNIW